MVHPSDGLVLCATPSAIPARAPHPYAVRLFMEWLLSQEYVRLIAADGSESVLTGVPARSGMPPLADQKIISPMVDKIRTGVLQVIEQWLTRSAVERRCSTPGQPSSGRLTSAQRNP
jgi:ABC-type Fe3+ transport system substrate-binding protein